MNEQESFWAGSGGDAYANNSGCNSAEIEGRLHSRKSFYDLFKDIPKATPILEVGCNCGVNLGVLHKLGFTNLNGIDIGEVALGKAQDLVPSARFTRGSILDLPFKNKEFGAVFSMGVLMHQDPKKNLSQAMDEMYRCSFQYILGREDTADKTTPILYKGVFGLYWRFPLDQLWEKQYSWGSSEVSFSPCVKEVPYLARYNTPPPDFRCSNYKFSKK